MYKEIKANLWDFEDDVKVITTNGNLNKKHENIMGKGTALQAKQKYPQLTLIHGENIRLYGNEVFYYPIYNNGFKKVIKLPISIVEMNCPLV